MFRCYCAWKVSNGTTVLLVPPTYTYEVNDDKVLEQAMKQVINECAEYKWKEADVKDNLAIFFLDSNVGYKLK